MPENLVLLFEKFSAQGLDQIPVSAPEYLDWEKQTRSYERIAAFNFADFNDNGKGPLGGGLGSALGSWCGGLIHDWTGSYATMIGFALASVLLGMVPFLVVPALRR